MKNVRLLGFLMILASSFMFIQCTSEPIQGPPGTAGTDGVDGVDGVDGTTECIACHNTANKEHAESTYLLSKHAIETTMYDGRKLSQYGNRSSCTQCHTSQGYIDYMETGSVTGDAYPDADQHITCVTCHSTHTSFDFANDGYDYALRQGLMPVDLIVDPSYSIDMGASNTCVNCHQPRTAPPTDDGNGTFTITSTHWGPHHGPQSTLLEGLNASLIPGTTGYPGVGSATHRTGASCIACHMGESTSDTEGAHTWNVTEEACLTCHTSGAPTEVAGLADDMTTLAGLLANVQGVDSNGDPITGIVIDGSPVQGTFDISASEAAWNYLYILEDKSNGIHNPTYSKAIIKNAIEVLQQ
ncbi:MAG: hypothetical protein R3342_06000 [Lutibacter sp.]|uniref:hypothetical protein n=1 Tax=Lutibacter sp. TaxID=1925666 RepID=UPI00299E99DB|nr:hypothetical protein [Lutibacter sp.]MDX1829083.1 hypothetical protein [Lutibacter sp.]